MLDHTTNDQQEVMMDVLIRKHYFDNKCVHYWTYHCDCCGLEKLRYDHTDEYDVHCEICNQHYCYDCAVSREKIITYYGDYECQSCHKMYTMKRYEDICVICFANKNICDECWK